MLTLSWWLISSNNIQQLKIQEFNKNASLQGSSDKRWKFSLLETLVSQIGPVWMLFTDK